MASERVIVDTSAFYALISDKDEFHLRAKLAYEQLIDEKVELYTSSYVLVETSALIHRRLGYSLLEAFVESIKASMRILWVSRRDHWKAWDFMKQGVGRELSFVDCTTVILAKSLDARLFTFDEDFAREGLTMIPH